MFTGDYSWTLNTLIAVPTCIVLFIIFLASGSGFMYARKHEEEGPYSDRDIFLGSAAVSYGLAIVVVIAFAWSMYPFSGEYHQYRTAVGTVAQIDSRLLGGSEGGTTQRFVVTFEEGLELSCDDTRCAYVEVGDVLTLECVRQWQYAGVDGYNCNYGGVA